MDNHIQQLIKSNIRYINHVNEQTIWGESNVATTSFAIDDAIATTVGNNLAPTTFRLWSHNNTVVLGIPDARLPYFETGVKHLQKKGYDVVIRNSGGLAVVLDHGVLNISFVIPNAKQVSIHYGYDLMVAFIRLLLQNYTTEIKAYEIVGSYCPGDYDLSINGVKFAGLSQRRVRNGVAVQIYLDIEDSSKQRANLIKDFYHISKRDLTTKIVYPEVNPAVMGSLNELLQEDFTVESFINHITTLLQQYNQAGIVHKLIAEEAIIFNKRLEQMKKRNEVITKIK